MSRRTTTADLPEPIRRRVEHAPDCPFGKPLPLKERIDALAQALYTATRISSRDIAAGLYANLRAQGIDLFRPGTFGDLKAEMDAIVAEVTPHG